MNLNALVEATYAQYQAELAAEEYAKEAHTAKAKADGIAAFKAALEAEIGAEMVETLDVTFEPDFRAGKWDAVGKWVDSASDSKWTVDCYRDASLRWRVRATDRVYRGFSDDLFNHTASAGNLRDAILIGIGTARTKVSKRQAEAEAKAARAEQERQRKADEERQQQDRLDEIKRVDAEIREKIAARKEQGAAWQWAAGKQVTIYVMTYATGGVVGEDGDMSFDYDAAYTLTDALDENGYIAVQPKYGAPRLVKLNMATHMPVWERLTLTGILDTPAALLMRDEVQMMGISEIYSYGEFRGYQYDSDECFVSVDVGFVPVQWVRDLVDRA